MISDAVLSELKKIAGEDNLSVSADMSEYTTFKCGGKADCLIEAAGEEIVTGLISYLQKLDIDYVIIGNGSNILVSDQGFEGVVIRIGKLMNNIVVHDNILEAQAGALLSMVAQTACKNSLSGLEFAGGIPGSVGGGVVMNAGAYGGELKQVVSKVRVTDAQGEIMELDNDTMEFGYRTSVIKNRKLTVLKVWFLLNRGDEASIRAGMDDFNNRRREKQPLEYPSAGSTFKRPEGYFAGKLIEDAGLRGYTVGGACISEKHCGFVINKNKATAKDVADVIRHVQNEVKEKFDVNLEREVIYIGDFK